MHIKLRLAELGCLSLNASMVWNGEGKTGREVLRAACWLKPEGSNKRVSVSRTGLIGRKVKLGIKRELKSRRRTSWLLKTELGDEFVAVSGCPATWEGKQSQGKRMLYLPQSRNQLDPSLHDFPKIWRKKKFSPDKIHPETQQILH
jgi:hypothetical protein